MNPAFNGNNGGLAGNNSTNNGVTNIVNTSIFLTPIAAPGILGFYSFAVASVIIGTRWAQWYGLSNTTVYLWPMLFIFGLIQLICAMFSFLARDSLATAFHGIWGATWLSVGIYYLYVAYGHVPILNDGGAYGEIAIWFAVLTGITFILFLASFSQSFGTVLVTLVTTAAALLATIAYWHGHYHVFKAAGWVFFFAGILAFITASAWLLEYQFMRAVIPFNNFNLYNRFAFLNRGMLYDPVVLNRGLGEPGVMKGQ